MRKMNVDEFRRAKRRLLDLRTRRDRLMDWLAHYLGRTCDWACPYCEENRCLARFAALMR